MRIGLLYAPGCPAIHCNLPSMQNPSISPPPPSPLLRPSIADLQAFTLHQVARPDAAISHWTLGFDSRPIQAEPSLRIGIPCNLLFTAPLGDVHTSKSAPSAETVWIFELRLYNKSAAPHPLRSSAKITIDDLRPMGRYSLANGIFSGQEIQQ